MSKPIFADVGFRTIVNYFFALLPVGVIVVSSPIAIWHQAVEVAGTEIRFDVSQVSDGDGDSDRVLSLLVSFTTTSLLDPSVSLSISSSFLPQ